MLQYFVYLDGILTIVFLAYGFVKNDKRFKIVGLILLGLFILELLFISYILDSLNGSGRQIWKF